MADKQKLALIASDGGKFLVDKEVVEMSALLKNMIEGAYLSNSCAPYWLRMTFLACRLGRN